MSVARFLELDTCMENLKLLEFNSDEVLDRYRTKHPRPSKSYVSIEFKTHFLSEMIFVFRMSVRLIDIDFDFRF